MGQAVAARGSETVEAWKLHDSLELDPLSAARARAVRAPDSCPLSISWAVVAEVVTAAAAKSVAVPGGRQRPMGRWARLLQLFVSVDGTSGLT